MLVSLGKNTVVSAGSPIRVVSKVTNCNTVYFQALVGNVGIVYIGLSGLVKATLTNVLRVLMPLPSNPLTIDSWTAQGITPGPIDLSTIFFDADNPGDGVLISYLVS